MIILDDDEEQLPKLASPPPVHTLVRLPRESISSPSLPDYETSQKLHRLGQWKRKVMTRRWRWAIYGLIAYFVITVAIGVPLIVIKTRKSSMTYKNPSLLYPSPQYGAANSSIPGFNFGTGPLSVDDATACDIWDFKDRKSNGVYKAQLEYTISITDTVFVQSNVSSPSNTTPTAITGSLTVKLSDDSKDINASIKVTMTYSGTDIREMTSVCLMNVPGADGLYIYVPRDLIPPDQLHFNVTVLLPRRNDTDSVYIDNFVTMLSLFSQNVGDLSPDVTFGSIALSGQRSKVTIGSIQAQEIYVKSSFAEIDGSVKSSNDNDDNNNNDDDDDDNNNNNNDGDNNNNDDEPS